MVDFPIPNSPSTTIRRRPDTCPATWLSLTTLRSRSISASRPTTRTGAEPAPSCSTSSSGLNTLASSRLPFSQMLPAGRRTSLWEASPETDRLVMLATFSLHRMGSFCLAAATASRAAVLTESPITAYSHRILGSPTTPQKHVPMAIPAVPGIPAAAIRLSTLRAATMQGVHCWLLPYPGSPNTNIIASPLSSTVIWKPWVNQVGEHVSG
mmetsp:Transcript_24261/g.67462  ORF Transcript_24261/g.67462 Transcript_24261/m.67462 type:complete len:210 (-) Transcript_24261:152-781(-)